MNEDFDLEQQNINQRRKYAELLRSQNKQPEGQMVSGHYIAPPMLANLNVIGNQLLGQYGGMQADKQNAALNKRKNTALVEGLKQYQSTAQGMPAQTIQPSTPNDDEGNAMPVAQTDAIAGDPRAAAQGLIASDHPMLQELGIKQLVAGLAPKQAEGVNINGQLVDKYTGAPMGSVVPKQKEDFTLTPGGIRFGPDGKQLAAVGDFNKAFNQDGTPNTGFQSYEIGKARAGASKTNVSVNAGPKEFEKQLGELDAKQLGKWRDNAEVAQSTIGTVQAMRDAEKKGAYSGGLANQKMAAASLINGITGYTPKGLVGSETYNSEANKLVLDRVKTLGANPSNADRDFIEKTVPQLATSAEARKQMADFMEKKALQSINTYKKADSYARSNSGLGGFDMLQQLPDAAPTPSGTPSTSGFKIIGVK